MENYYDELVYIITFMLKAMITIIIHWREKDVQRI